MAKLRNLKLDEFSIVRGSTKTPANPEAVALVYKAAEREEGNDLQIKKSEPKPAETKQKSLARRLADVIEGVLKAQTTTTVQSSSTSQYSSEYTETVNSEAGAPPNASGDGSTTIVITDAVEKTTPAPAPAAAAAGQDGDVGEVVKAIEPLAKAVVSIDSRLAKLESRPVGSQQVAKSAGITVTDRSGAKFPEFTKFLSQASQLSPGQRLTKATITSSGWSYGLSMAEAAVFIDYVVDQSTLLKLCRTVQMPDKKYNIDKIGLGGKVLVKGTPGTDPGDTVSVSGPTQVQLDAEEVIAIVSIGDDTLEDNIEGDAFVQHLLNMIAAAAANELEEAAIHGDTTVPDAGILDRWDGWYKLAKAAGAHVVEAMTDTNRYWPGDAAAKATKLLKALPSKYRKDLRNLRCILPEDLYLDYSDELAAHGSSEGFMAITGIKDLSVRSVQHVRVPLLKTDMSFTYSATPYTDGTFVMFTDLRNLIFGIHRGIKIEPFRQPRKRCTDYVLSMRADAQIENGDAIAIYDHAKVQP
jgi:hypothetical protein